jgi:hypothetical protein
VSSVELLNYLKKQLGVITRILEEKGVLTVPYAGDHIFIPEVTVPDYGVTVDINGFLILVKVPYTELPVKMNLDRPVTNEYTVVYPGMGKIIGRFTRKLYLQAPTGYSSKAVVEALKVG